MATTSVLGDPPAAVGGHHLQVVDADALLGGQREDLLGAGLEGGPGQLLEVAPRVPVHHAEAEVPRVPVLQILEGVGRDQNSEQQHYF